jgi:hypothetical protein
MCDFILSTNRRNQSRGFGWALYPNSQVAQSVIVLLNGVNFLNSTLGVTFAKRKIGKFDPRNAGLVRCLKSCVICNGRF